MFEALDMEELQNLEERLFSGLDKTRTIHGYEPTFYLIEESWTEAYDEIANRNRYGKRLRFEVLTDRELETLDYMMYRSRRAMWNIPQKEWPYGDADPFDDVTEILVDVMNEERRRGIGTYWPDFDGIKN